MLTFTSAEPNHDIPSLLSHRSLENAVSNSLHWDMSPHADERAILLGTEDNLYLAPTQSEIKELIAFYEWRREDSEYVTDAWDCDNAAREFKHWADVWALHRYKHSAAAIAVGMVYVRAEGDISDIFPQGGHGYHPRSYHVLGAILREDLQWFFFEPSTRILVPVESLIYEGSLTVLKINL